MAPFTFACIQCMHVAYQLGCATVLTVHATMIKMLLCDRFLEKKPIHTSAEAFQSALRAHLLQRL